MELDDRYDKLLEQIEQNQTQISKHEGEILSIKMRLEHFPNLSDTELGGALQKVAHSYDALAPLYGLSKRLKAEQELIDL